MPEVFKFDGFDLDDVANGFIIDDDLMWMNGNRLSSTIENAGGLQGVFSSATFVRGRTLRINGLIRAITDIDLQDKLDTLKKIFSIPWSPVNEGTKEFFVEDSNGNQWVAQARISDDIEFVRDGTTARYSVSIFLSDSRYRSLSLQSFAGEEGISTGVSFPVSLPFALNESSGTSVVSTIGNVASPLRVTVVATGDINTSITVQNITNGDFFSFSATGVAGDIFVIDSGLTSRNVSLTKNGTNILSQKIAGSTWLSVLGSMEFNTFDTDADDDMDVLYEFYDRLS